MGYPLPQAAPNSVGYTSQDPPPVDRHVPQGSLQALRERISVCPYESNFTEKNLQGTWYQKEELSMEKGSQGNDCGEALQGADNHEATADEGEERWLSVRLHRRDDLQQEEHAAF